MKQCLSCRIVCVKANQLFFFGSRGCRLARLCALFSKGSSKFKMSFITKKIEREFTIDVGELTTNLQNLTFFLSAYFILILKIIQILEWSNVLKMKKIFTNLLSDNCLLNRGLFKPGRFYLSPWLDVKTKFGVAKSYAGIMQIDWFKLVMWLSTVNQSALFQHRIGSLASQKNYSKGPKVKKQLTNVISFY